MTLRPYRRRDTTIPLRLQLDSERAPSLFWIAWYVLGFLVVAVVPSRLGPGGLMPQIAAEDVPQHLVMGATFLVLALYVQLSARRRNGVALLSVVVATLACYGIAFVALRWGVHLRASRMVVLISTMLGLGLLLLPFFRLRLRVVGVLALVGATAAWAKFRPAPPPPADVVGAPRSISTALERVAVSYDPDVIGPIPDWGGALEAYGDGYVLVTAHGAFYRVVWDSASSALRATRLALTAPLDRETYVADHRGQPGLMRLRVTDLTIDTSSTPATLYVAHQFWNHDGRCFTIRVSASPFHNEGGDATAAWRTVYETQPCLTPSSTFDDYDTGGRLAWDARRRLLLTVGDHGFDGRNGPVYSQQPDVDYGKVVRLDLAGGREVVSIGHRNAQGLAVDRAGRVWLTEHGPQGGDELNLVRDGRNYGWPIATYGTEYGMHVWPGATNVRDHGAFEEPVHAFVPSVAVSNLIQLGPGPFASWEGDLLVSSLGKDGLYRVRLRGDRVVYVEPIPIKLRVRDLEQGRDGRILLWIDGGALAMLSAGAPATAGETQFGPCTLCHKAETGDVGPQLSEIVGRPIASAPGFDYSPALRALEGEWTVEKLDAFLADPQRYVPGTRMKFPGIPDPDARRAVIEYLGGLGRRR